MSTTLRVTLEPTLLGNLSDAGGIFWAGRVEDWVTNRRNESVFRPLDSPRVTTLPQRAIVYLAAPNNVMQSQLDGLRRNWSELVWSVQVERVEIAQGIPTRDADLSTLGAANPITKLGQKVGGTVVNLAVLAVVALIVVAAVKSHKKGGTLSW